MKAGTLIGILAGVAVLGTLVVVGANKGWFGPGKKNTVPVPPAGEPFASDDQIRRMIDAANSSGADTFAGLSFDEVKTRLKNPTSADIEQAIAFFKKGSAAMTAGDTDQFISIMARMFGKQPSDFKS